MLNRRTLLAGVAALSVLAVVGTPFAQETAPMATDTLATTAGDLVINPVNHSSMVLTLGDKTWYVDPVGGAELYADYAAPTAILITHEHGDHFDVPTLEAIAGDTAPLLVSQAVYDGLPATLQARASVIGNGEATEVDGVAIDSVAAYNTTPDRSQFHPQGRGNGYILNIGDSRVYIAGDTEGTPEMLALTDIDAAFLPMNLPYTMTGAEAAEAVKAFRPAIVYPYHYGEGEEHLAFAEAVAGEEGIEVRQLAWYGTR